MSAVQDIEPSRPIGLPFDILEEIISGIDNSFGSYRADALKTLASCSLVSRELRDAAQRRLFSCFRIFPRAVSLKKFMNHVGHAGDDDRFIRYIKKLDILYASQSPHFIGGFEIFLGKLIRVEMVIFSWDGFWNECFWDRLEDHECEAFLRLLWSPSLKTVVTSPSLAPFPWVIASFFGPNVETLKVPGLVYGYKSQTVGKMQRQLAKLHPADLQPATRGTVRLKHISLLYKGGIALLLYVGAQKRRWLSLDSLQTLLVCSSQNRPLGLEIDIGLFFRLCPNLRAFCIYPGVPEWRSPFLTHDHWNVDDLTCRLPEFNWVSIYRSGTQLTLRNLPYCDDSDGISEWLTPYTWNCPYPSLITSIDIVLCCSFSMYGKDLEGTLRRFDFMPESWKRLDEAINSRFHNLKRVCLTLEVGEACYQSGSQKDLFPWLESPGPFPRLREKGVFALEKKFVTRREKTS